MNISSYHFFYFHLSLLLLPCYYLFMFFLFSLWFSSFLIHIYYIGGSLEPIRVFHSFRFVLHTFCFVLHMFLCFCDPTMVRSYCYYISLVTWDLWAYMYIYTKCHNSRILIFMIWFIYSELIICKINFATFCNTLL